MSSTDTEIIKCRNCHYIEIFFTEQRGPNGMKIPFEVSTKLAHDCMFSDWFECGFGCGGRLYFDYTNRSAGALNYLTSDPHICPRRDKQ